MRTPMHTADTDQLLIATSNEDIPIVRVNGVTLRAEDIAREMQYHPAGSRREAVFLAAQAMVLRELLRQRAVELGLSLQPRDNEPEDEATLRSVLEQEVQVPEVTEAELALYYGNNPRKFTTPPLVAARHILLAADPVDAEERAQRQEQARQLLLQLQQGADFASLARQHSDCPSREQGAELGQLSKGQTVPEFERALFRLPVGLAPQPVETRYGYHLVEVQQRVEGELL
ncbi:MAG: peptidylprolyl isomerase, partial [Bacteroidales bacterium]|nr:peptidylprolyl isomerase [Bacteroidales bacterium]